MVIDDEVRYTDKYWRTKTAQMGNTPMVVTEEQDAKSIELDLYNVQSC